MSENSATGRGPRVRFAPSPTGYLHIGSARTFIFNWLYARHTGGTMILRIDDTDAGRNTQESVDSIFDGLKWLGLDWDELYRQSERLDLHRRAANEILAKGFAYRDFTPASARDDESSRTWLFNADMRALSVEETDRRAAAGEPFVLRFRVPRETRETVEFRDLVYGSQSKATADIEDFALLRSNGMPTYHMASCADDADMRISHIIRGQDHLTNTFKHVLIFEALGVPVPCVAHLPLLTAPDGAKLSKRNHGPVVSVTTYRDAGFLPEAFLNSVCLLGWAPKDHREKLSKSELVEAFSLEGINHSNPMINFSDAEPFDPKAVWLNGEYIRSMPIAELAAVVLPYVLAAGFSATPEHMLKITPLIQERMKLLGDVAIVADFFFRKDLPPYPAIDLIPDKGDAAMAMNALRSGREVLEKLAFNHDALDAALRSASKELGIKAGQMFVPIRVAVCGRKNAPPLFQTLEVLGRETVLERLDKAMALLGGAA